MKPLALRTLLFSISVLIGLSLQAQEEVVLLNYASLQKKFQKSEADIQNPKKNINPAIWYNRGKLMQDIYLVDLQYVSEGIDKTMLKLYYKEPVSTRMEGNYEVLQYPRIEYYFENGLLSRWKKSQSVTENPLEKAYEAYMKVLELDTKGSMGKKVKTQLDELKKQFKQDGINSYYSEDKAKAVKDFSMVLSINELPAFNGEIDTIMFQYSAIISRELGDYKSAAVKYSKLAKMGWGGPNTYLILKNDYIEMGDSAKALETLENAFEAYPDTLNVVANLIDFYIQAGEVTKGLEKIENSITANPDKGELYYWKGRLLINTEDDDRIDKAIKVYEIAIEKSPDVYYAYYDLGFIYFLQGQEYFNQAGLEKDLKYRAEINEIGVTKYKECIPLLEKAAELNSTNKDMKRETLDTLKRVYYKLEMSDKYDEVIRKMNEL